MEPVGPVGGGGAKRERDDFENLEGAQLLEEDPNDRVAKVILLDPRLAPLQQRYRDMSHEQQVAWLQQSQLLSLPLEIQQVIASVSVGTLMTLARTSQLFAEIARNDDVWKHCYARDFPADYTYCRNKVPWFVLTPNHVLYRGPADIDARDLSPWKRFYLWTNVMYRNAVWAFAQRYRKHFWDFRVEPINVELDPQYPPTTARELYRWAHKYMYGAPLVRFGQSLYDYRSRLAWAFVLHIVWLMYPLQWEPNPRYTELEVIDVFWIIASANEWMKPYLALCVDNGPFTIQGGSQPNTRTLLDFFAQTPDARQFIETFNPKTYRAFSIADETDYEQFLEDLMDNDQAPELYRLRDISEDDGRSARNRYIQNVFKIWRAASEFPCVLSISHPEFQGINVMKEDRLNRTTRFYMRRIPNFVSLIHRTDVETLSEDDRAMLEVFQSKWDLRAIMLQLVGQAFAFTTYPRLPELHGSTFLLADLFRQFSTAPRRAGDELIIHMEKQMNFH